MDVLQVHKNATRGFILHDKCSHTRNAVAISVENGLLQASFVEKRVVMKGNRAPAEGVLKVEEVTVAILQCEGVDRNGIPAMDLFAPIKTVKRTKQLLLERQGATEERNLLYGSGECKSKKCDLGIIALPTPISSLFFLIALQSNSGVLSKAGRHHDWGVALEEAVSLPAWRCIIDPSTVAVDKCSVKGFDVFKV